MASRALIDTGVLLAHVNLSDRRHTACSAAIAQAPMPLVTTVAVITELFYFAIKTPRLLAPAWRMVSAGWITLAPITDADLPALETLMIRYADRPMDFADATLVHVAGRESIRTILTIDHADFETYRFGRNRVFDIYPRRA